MDLVKLYIVQSISAASNNLRLNTQQIEVVALLREMIVNSENLGDDLINMKKITELSTLAIRLFELYNFLTQGKIDFFKISDKFREHSQYLIRDLNRFLDQVSPKVFEDALKKLRGESADAEILSVDLSKREPEEDEFLKKSEAIKEEIIMLEDLEDKENFQEFEEKILKPIKPLDAYLKQLSNEDANYDEIEKYVNIFEENAELSYKNSFDVISSMHKIIIKALNEIKVHNLIPEKDVIEAMRACLIVIVAVVRGKEVDITSYLNKAEMFYLKLSGTKNQV